MARNRKRAKDRRARQPEAASVRGRRVDPGRIDPEVAPDPIAHAAPDVELAEAQLAVGRPPIDEDAEPGPAPSEEFEGEAVEGGKGSLALEAGRGAGTAERVSAHREPVGRRLIGFAQGSWRELQRVQWPDRRQVMQATSVVIGFVIVAGAFLGVADFVAGKLVSFILK